MTPPPCNCAHVERVVVWTRGRTEPVKQRYDRCIHPAGPHTIIVAARAALEESK